MAMTVERNRTAVRRKRLDEAVQNIEQSRTLVAPERTWHHTGNDQDRIHPGQGAKRDVSAYWSRTLSSVIG
jgi:hypothetical protein